MRLINTSTYALEEFLSEETTYRIYAILSHRWEAEEISFDQMKNGNVENGPGIEKMGWRKIKRFCQLAADRGYEWAWVDTCCIDKSSSSELSEAINSMFRWYQNAAVCIAYLCDVDASRDDFVKSDWFNRGWTLQELLAPDQVEFYGCTWAFLGDSRNLCQDIFRATRIPVPLLYDSHNYRFTDCSVAQRMSWAAHRQTSRPEDLAYSLLGLFDVHMPLLYGEGSQKAFYRLQLEILHGSDDETIFCWTRQLFGSGGALASLPGEFQDCGNIRVSRAPIKRKPYSMTNKGLQIELSLQHIFSYSENRFSKNWCAPLNCTKDGQQVKLVLQPHVSRPPRREMEINDRNVDINDGSFEGQIFHCSSLETHERPINKYGLVRANILIASNESRIIREANAFPDSYPSIVRDLRLELLHCSRINEDPELSILDIQCPVPLEELSGQEALQRFSAQVEHLTNLNIPEGLIKKYKKTRDPISN